MSQKIMIKVNGKAFAREVDPTPLRGQVLRTTWPATNRFADLLRR